MDALLVLEDGRVFPGRSFGAVGETLGEVVFHTGMTGYQEILTDPSYCGQLVTMTAPHIGNTGVNDFDPESFKPQVAGLIVRAYSEDYSSWRARGSLAQLLRDHGIVAMTDVDTRALTRHIRTAGAMRGIIGTNGTSREELLAKVRQAPVMQGLDLTRVVSCEQPYSWTHNSAPFTPPATPPAPAEARFHVVAYDFGLKRTILRRLVDHGCRVTVVPGTTPANEALALKPDGIFYSNGPGDPAATVYAFENLFLLLGQKPVFGICLGNQLMGLALGGRTYKLPFGHHGANHPVRHLASGKVEITSQNHGFAVDPDSLPAGTEITHINLNDQTVEGLRNEELGCFSVQYHPEAGPGPHDANYLFAEFVQLMEARR
ncbi:glutamine-hydrolyzing carbamoyl-phosphate synthase small subunit [Candidatus Viridilinea mediisalina]|uniref:Carbamoyl phosphate synthase small chain n=1 Tax=Candidatus Viridilinea mediisalina TaxID=2024553 RepID=A0A2A6RIK8_9CHLR|nr:glutamine-hydrolyzing carbamoyl-phosphate synthase small subunit [Candidatus Viridilinea mediisalina]PDW02719.1 carbamoyl phosphate synthase small subunit [Candidatus Viridilinea mediisalina]